MQQAHIEVLIFQINSFLEQQKALVLMQRSGWGTGTGQGGWTHTNIGVRVATVDLIVRTPVCQLNHKSIQIL